MKYLMAILMLLIIVLGCTPADNTMSQQQIPAATDNKSAQVPPIAAQPSDNGSTQTVAVIASPDMTENALKSTVLIFATDQLEKDKAVNNFWDNIEYLKPITSQQKVTNYTDVLNTSWNQGSGVIIDRQGYILTNRHVIESTGGAQLVYVFMYENDGLKIKPGREFVATVICKHPHEDLAVIKITPRNGDLPYCFLGDSDKVRMGQTAMALGYPGGVLTMEAWSSYKWKTGEIVLQCDPTSTSGSISAKRKFDTYPGNSSMEEQDADFAAEVIQTDCEINPGNSGGPLIDQQGNVIGIITSKIVYQTGIGFAIAINEGKNLIKAAMARPIVGINDGTFLTCDDNGYCCSQSAWESNPARRCNQLCDEKYRYSEANAKCCQRCKDNTR